MNINESLVQKWKPLLEHQDLPRIDSVLKRNVVAQLLDNTEIAIKVKHPDITNNLDNYLEIIKLFKFLQSFNYIKKRYNLIFNIDDFLNDIIQQCYLRIESSNSKKFKYNFS